jgi:transposase
MAQSQSGSSMHVSLISFNPAAALSDDESDQLQQPANTNQNTTTTISQNNDLTNALSSVGETETQRQERLHLFAQSLQNGLRGQAEETENEKLVLTEAAESSKAKPSKLVYKKYTDEQIMGYINLIIEGMSVKEASEKMDITINTAYRYRKMWNQGGVTPVRNKRGPAEGVMSKLKDEHTRFIINYIDHETTPSSLTQIKEALRDHFEGLSVSNSALHRHMRAKCAVSLKRLEKSPETRNDVEVMAAIENWIASKDMDFEKNCVFIGEASFIRHEARNHGWSSKNKSTTRPTNVSGVSITILGAISPKGVIDVSLRKPTATTPQKRHADGSIVENEVENEHYLGYLMNVMNVLQSHGLSGYYLVMDDAPIIQPMLVKRKIEERGFKCAYLPTVLPFPNPIEKFWVKVQSGVSRTPFTGEENQTSNRIMESCSKVTPSDCREWIRHSVPFSPHRLSLGKNFFT